MNIDQNLFFHVGLGKVASSYLQQEVFPRLRGIHYIHTKKYKQSKKIIPKLKSKKILVSREFDRQFEREISWFADAYPQAGVIIVLRRHDSWVASQYRRHVKNGWHFDFEQFLDLSNDQGLWKQKDLFYYPKLELIEKHYDKKPLVLFYDELLRDPWSFMEKIMAYTCTSISGKGLSRRKVHTSYSEKQLKLLRWFCRRFVKHPPEGHRNKIKHWLLYRPYWALFHLVMYVAYIIPNRLIPKGPLINDSSLLKVKDAYAEDWQMVLSYARQNNPSFDGDKLMND